MIKTFYWKDAVPSGAILHRSLQDGGTAPASATTTTGWNAGANAVGQQRLMVGGTEVVRTDAGWGSTLQPAAAPSTTLGDCWRTESSYRGSFAAGTWNLTFGVRSVTAAYTGRFRLRLRVWKSANASGAGATEITSSTQLSSTTVANLSTSADTSVTFSWTPGSIALVDEYLFFQIAFEITTVGAGNTTDIDFRVGSAYTMVSTEFSQALVGFGLALAKGQVANGVLLTGAAVPIASGIVNAGLQRARLYWARLQTPPPASTTTQPLTGAALALTGGSILFPGATRARLYWAQLTLPPTQNVGMGGFSVAIGKGTLTPFTGTIVPLTGAAIGLAAGSLSASKGATLVGAAIALASGSIVPIDEFYIFSGLLSPLVTKAFSGQALGLSGGFLGVATTGGTVVPLIGKALSFAQGNMVPGGTVAVPGQEVVMGDGDIAASQQIDATTPLSGLDLLIRAGAIVGFGGLTPPPPPSHGFDGSGGGAKAIEMGRMSFMDRVELLVKKGMDLPAAMEKAEADEGDEDALAVLRLLEEEGDLGSGDDIDKAIAFLQRVRRKQGRG